MEENQAVNNIEGETPQQQPIQQPFQQMPVTAIKKPFYKKWWVWTIAAVVLIIIIIPKNNNNQQDTLSSSNTQAQSSTVSSSSIQEVATGPYSAELSNGNFTAGIDFPAGNYDLEAISGGGNVLSDNAISGGVNIIMGVKSDDMYQKSFKNAKFPKGVVLRISNVTIKISSEKADINKMTNRSNTATKTVNLEPGNYVAGNDFEAGIYDIKAISGNGNVSSDNILKGGINAIMGVKPDEMYQKEFKNIVLSKDVTIKVSNVTIQLVPSK